MKYLDENNGAEWGIKLSHVRRDSDLHSTGVKHNSEAISAGLVQIYTRKWDRRTGNHRSDLLQSYCLNWSNAEAYKTGRVLYYQDVELNCVLNHTGVCMGFDLDRSSINMHIKIKKKDNFSEYCSTQSASISDQPRY